MLNLTISYKESFRHFIDIELAFTAIKGSELILQLPSWRPGRYELADFSQYIQKFDIIDSNGNNLEFQKEFRI